jgi:hypothetical protein
MFIGGVSRITLAFLVVCSGGAAMQTRAEQGQPTLWSHNGSVIYLVKNGKGREFHYEKPRAEMIQAGAYRGALLFAGQSITTSTPARHSSLVADADSFRIRSTVPFLTITSAFT